MPTRGKSSAGSKVSNAAYQERRRQELVAALRAWEQYHALYPERTYAEFTEVWAVSRVQLDQSWRQG